MTPYRLKLQRWWLVLSSLALSAQAQAQEPSTEGDTFELSPFVVEGGEEGYRATNTLAGTRLKTSLKDVGTAISVATKEFMDDIGAVDAQSLLTYTVGTEVGGLGGNFAGSPVTDGRPNSTEQRENPGGNQRVRGLASAQLARNYFLTDIPLDSYNTSRVTINRGPNSLLFGIGSAGGVVNNSTVQPIMGNDFTEVSVRLGQRGSHRETIDVNKEVIEGRLGLRLAGLYEDKQYRQDPAFERDKRLYGSMYAILNKGQDGAFLGETALRGSYEIGETDGNPPNLIPPNDGLTHWWELPDTDFESYTGQPGSGFLTSGAFVPQRTLDWRQPGTGHGVGPYISPWFLQMAVFHPNYGAGPESVNGLQGGMGIQRYQQLSPERRAELGLSGNIQHSASRNLFGLPIYPNFVAESVDREVFDYYNHLLGGDNGWRRREFDALNVALEQSFWDYKGGIELAFDRQGYDQDSMLPFGGGQSGGTGESDINVDIAEVLYVTEDSNGDGQPETYFNPNVGRALVRERGAPQRIRRRDQEAARAQAYVKLNGEDVFSNENAEFWFGNHTFTGIYIEQEFDSHNSNTDIGWESDEVDAYLVSNNQFINQGRRQVISAYYVSDDLRGVANPEDVRITPLKDRLPQDGDTYQLYYWNPGANGSMETGEFYVRRFLDSENVGRTELESEIVSWQSHLLDDHLIGLIGWRSDSQTVYEMVDLDNDDDPTTEFRFPDGAWNPESTRLETEPVGPAEEEDSVTWSVVGVYPEKLLGELPLGAELRLFVNESENFNPVGARRNLRGEVLPSPAGTTEEWGFMLDLFEGKLSARVNFFDTAVSTSTFSALNGASNSIVNLPSGWGSRYLTAFEDWEADGLSEVEAITAFAPSLIDAGIDSYDEILAHIFTLQPESIQALADYRIEEVNGVDEVRFNNIDGLVATTDFAAEGWELELVGNPTRNLRLSFNLAKQETVQTNLAPDLKEYATEMETILQASPFYNLKDVPANETEPNTFGTRFRNAVSSLLAAEAAKEGTVSLEQRKYRANLVANYTFRDGWLDGFNLGAAARYQSAVATGYPTAPNEDGNPVPILDRAFFDEEEIRGDLFFGYRRAILNDSVDWRIQLNIRNAIGDEDPIPVWTNPDGQVAVVRIPPLTEIFLTNTFRF